MPLDHSGATAGTLPLAYAVLPATGPRAGTIVFLTGGPGEPAVRYTTEVGQELAAVRPTHDIVLVDQRGTGDSGRALRRRSSTRASARRSSASSGRS